jgi:putative hydrolase of the HAD superfamily
LTINIQHHQHFSFDLWLTLIKSHPEFKHKRNLLFKEFFAIEASTDKLSEVIRYYDLLCNSINEKRGLNFDTFEIYYLILNALNVNINEIGLEKLTQFYNETELLFMKFRPNLIDPKIDLLFKDIINQGKTINILSNTGFIKGFTLIKLLDYYQLSPYLSFQVYSDEVGFSKPNSKIFQLVYDEIKNFKSLEKKEILHIGDNKIADYNGALNFGFDALLLKI